MSFGDERGSDERDPLLDWPAFAQRVRARLEAGRAAYGDASFRAAPDTLLGELSQEALDLAGWGFVLWKRIESMRPAAQCSSPESFGDMPSARSVGDSGRLPPAS